MKSVLVAAGNLKVQSPTDAEDSLILVSFVIFKHFYMI